MKKALLTALIKEKKVGKERPFGDASGKPHASSREFTNLESFRSRTGKVSTSRCEP